MQVTFNFDKEKRSFTLTAEDELEKVVLKEMHDRVAKGQTVQIGKVETPEGPTEFRFEVKVNGYQGKVDRQYNETLPGQNQGLGQGLSQGVVESFYSTKQKG